MCNAISAAKTAATSEPEQDSRSSSHAMFAAAYERLKAMARRELGRMSGDSAGTTTLVHDLFLKVGASRDLDFSDYAKFFSYAARAMRHILVDRARRRISLKAGGDGTHVALSDPRVDELAIDPSLALQLDAALTELQADHARAAHVVELHFLAGLPLAGVAELLGVVRRTVDRDWRYARAFLLSRMD